MPQNRPKPAKDGLPKGKQSQNSQLNQTVEGTSESFADVLAGKKTAPKNPGPKAKKIKNSIQKKAGAVLAMDNELPEVVSKRRFTAELCADVCMVGVLYDPETVWETKKEDPDVFEERALIRKALSGVFTAALRALERNGKHAYARFEIPKGPKKTRKIEAPDGTGAYVHVDEDPDLKEAEEAVKMLQSKYAAFMERLPEESDEMKDEDWLELQMAKGKRQDPYVKLRAVLIAAFSKKNEKTDAATQDLMRSFDPKFERVNVLRTAQRLILKGLRTVPLSSEVCGFRPDSWAYEGLRRGLNVLHRLQVKKIESVYQIDIRNFFPSITHKMATESLKLTLSQFWATKEIPAPMIELVSEALSTLGETDERLAQGGHISPMFSNLYAQCFIDVPIKKMLQKYCTSSMTWDRFGEGSVVSYARYADDIVVLCNKILPLDVREDILTIIKRTGLQVAEEKVSFQVNHQIPGEPYKEKPYVIWWASIPPVAETPTPVGMEEFPRDRGRVNFRFMLPKSVERRICSYAFEAIKALSSRRITSWKELRREHEFWKMLGYFSHAYHVGKHGHLIVLWKKTLRVYPFSPELTHAWESFILRFNDILPESFKNGIFVLKPDEKKKK